MAQISISIGSVNSSFSFGNAQGQAIIDDYIGAYNGPEDGTNQEKLDWFLQHLIGHVREVHRGRRFLIEREQAEAAAQAAVKDWN